MKVNKDTRDFLSIVPVLGFGAILVVSLMYVTIPIIPALAQEFHASPGQVVWAVSVYGFAYAIGCLLFGITSDRYSRIMVLKIGLAALAVCTIAVAWSPSLHWLIGLRAVQGLIAASFPTVTLGYIGDVIAERFRPLAISIISSSFLMSGILGQLFGQAIEDWLGWRGIFELLATGYLILVAVTIYLPKGTSPPSGHSLPFVLRRTAGLLHSPSMLLSFAVSATVLFSFVTMYSGLSAYVLERFDLQGEGLMWIRIAGIPGIMVSLITGMLVRRFHSKSILIIGFAAAGVGLAGEALSGSLPLMVLFSILFVTGIAIANPSIIVIIGQLGGESRGSAFAINACAAFAGASLGPLLAQSIASFELLCAVLIVILLLASVTARYGIPCSN